jgi:hypothetical protein
MESQGALSAVAPHMAVVPTGAHFTEPPAQQAAWNQLEQSALAPPLPPAPMGPPDGAPLGPVLGPLARDDGCVAQWLCKKSPAVNNPRTPPCKPRRIIAACTLHGRGSACPPFPVSYVVRARRVSDTGGCLSLTPQVAKGWQRRWCVFSPWGELQTFMTMEEEQERTARGVGGKYHMMSTCHTFSTDNPESGHFELHFYTDIVGHDKVQQPCKMTPVYICMAYLTGRVRTCVSAPLRARYAWYICMWPISHGEACAWPGADHGAASRRQNPGIHAGAAQ